LQGRKKTKTRQPEHRLQNNKYQPTKALLEGTIVHGQCGLSQPRTNFNSLTIKSVKWWYYLFLSDLSDLYDYFLLSFPVAFKHAFYSCILSLNNLTSYTILQLMENSITSDEPLFSGLLEQFLMQRLTQEPTKVIIIIN